MATWVDVYSEMVEDCKNHESDLTAWELGFIDSIGRHVDNAIPLTKKQTETLEKIWNRVAQ